MKNDLQGGSRFNYRTKRKKTNLILNSLIAIVLLLIVFVAYSIFFSGNDKTAAKKDAQTTAAKTTAEKKQASPKIEKETSSATEKSSTDTQTKKDSEQNKKNQSTASDKKKSDQVQTVESPDGNTDTQASTSTTTAQHVTSYDTNSQDWQQMLAAMSSATGIDQGNMTVWFLGSDKSTSNGSVGTISAKDDKTKKFRVNLQWQDGKGWIATNVEQVQ